MHRAAGVRAGDHGRAGAGDRRQLPRPDLGRHVGVQRGVGAAGAAAQPLVIELDQVGIAPEDRPDVLVRLLHVPQVARVLHCHGLGESPGRSGERGDAIGQPLVHVHHAPAEGAGQTQLIEFALEHYFIVVSVGHLSRLREKLRR